MKIIGMAVVCLCMMLSLGEHSNLNMQIGRALTIDSPGACQGVSSPNGRKVLLFWAVIQMALPLAHPGRTM